MLFLNGRTASGACTVGSVGWTLPRLMLFRWSDCFQWQHCGPYVIWRFLRQLYPAVSPYSFKSVWLSRAKVTEGNQYFFINSVSQLLAPMSIGKMEEKLRSWKVPTSVWAVGALYSPFGHTGRKVALTVGVRINNTIQGFLKCGKTGEHVKQGSWISSSIFKFCFNHSFM